MPNQPPTILIVDDDKLVQRMAAAALRPSGCLLLFASSAEEALTLLQTDLPDLILLDSILPGMAGVQLCAQLRADPRMAGVTVVMLSSQDDPAIRAQASAAGVNEFIQKPFNLDNLRQRIQTHLE